MPVPSFHITCTRKLLLARDTYEFAFEKPEGFSFQPGQFVLFDVPLPDNAQDIQPRAYSIASAPQEQELMFAVKLISGGRASRWFEQTVSPGTVVRMQGPLGTFTLNTASRKDMLFIGTGSGVAPFRSQILHLLHRGTKRIIDLVFGVRSEQDLFWRETFQELANTHPNFHMHVALDEASELWEGHRGRVQSLAPIAVPDIAHRQVFICGNPDMTKEVKRLCLEEWKVDKAHLHVEGYV